MATWPASLPQYMELGMTDMRQQGFMRSPNDTGPAQQRKRFTATTRTLTGTMLFSAAQRSTFETFYTTTISEGSAEFDFTDPKDDATVSARFVEVPEFRALVGGSGGGAQWRVSLVIELLP